MWYKNITGKLFWISHKARVRQTDGRTDGQVQWVQYAGEVINV